MRENLGSPWKTMLLGGLGGLLWGIGMRGWMRFITSDPEFSWSGTLFIISATTLAGLMTGLAYQRWRRGRGQLWRLLGLFYLPLGSGAGAVMVPTFVLGGVTLGRSRWPSWVRILLGALALGLQVLFFLGEDFPNGRAIPALLIYAGFIGIETWGFSIMARPLPRSDVPAAGTQSQLAVAAGD